MNLNILGKLKTFVPVVATVVSILYIPANPGWGLLKDQVKAKKYDLAAQSFVAGMSGLRLGPIGGQRKTEIDVVGTLNPVDFRNAPYIKVGMWTRIAMEGIGAVQGFVKGLIKDVLG